MALNANPTHSHQHAIVQSNQNRRLLQKQSHGGIFEFLITAERIEALQHKECRLNANWAYTSEEILS